MSHPRRIAWKDLDRYRTTETVMMRSAIMIAGLLLVMFTLSCGDSAEVGGDRGREEVLRLATTTSTRDSGLLDRLLPPFESERGVRVDIVAVGTGAALALGRAGDVDAVLVHAKQAELDFMSAGHATRREEFMINHFILVGPTEDPAGIRGGSAVDAFRKLAGTRAGFVSRGDDSGTHKRELQLRAAARVEAWDGLIESGQGMGATLVMADEKNAYALVDGGTWLGRRANLRLQALVTGAAGLRNPYSFMPLSKKKHPGAREVLANAFADFLIRPEAQKIIAAYRVDGELLFRPTRLAASGR